MKFVRLALTGALVIGLSACDSNEAPTGQVAATLDGEEFTFLQINQELGSRGDITPEQRGEASQQALRRILQLHILAEEADDRGLGNTPAGASQLERLRKTAMADLLRADIRSSVPETSEDEANQFVADNRLMFAERYILIVRQLVVPQVSRDVIAEMEPIDTLPGIENLLNENAVTFRKTMGTVDSITLSPEVATQIAEVKVGDVYVIPQGNSARINVVLSKEQFPITGDDATRVAKELVFDRRVAGQTSTTLTQLIEKRMKDVVFAEDFKPNPAQEAESVPPPGTPEQSSDETTN